MKNMKGVAAMAPPPYAFYEDPITTFKHHNLLQDYLELHKETEGVKETLQRLKQKKLTLLDEVRFLRRRYKYLIKKQSPNPKPKQDLMQPHKQEVQIRNNEKKKKNHNAKETPQQHQALGIDLNQKGMFGNGKQASSASGFDVNMKERACNGEEAVMRNKTHVFDLNKIWREEEEALRYEEQQNEMRLSVCRDIGNGKSPAGKRKNTWEDRVVLRV